MTNNTSAMKHGFLFDKSRLLSISAVFLASVSLSGCLVVAPFQPPAGGPTASIEFINESSEPMGVDFYLDTSQCTDRRGAGLSPPQSRRAIVVGAGKEVAFTASMDVDNPKMLLVFGLIGGLAAGVIYKGCTPTLEFVPEAGRQYVFRMNSDGKNCTYQFAAQPTATQAPTDAAAISVLQREWIRPMGEAGPFCKAK